MISETFCAAPWTVHNINADGSNTICCVNHKIKYQGDRTEWLRSDEMQEVKRRMLNGESVKGCGKCYGHDADGTKSLRRVYNERTANLINIRRLRDPLYSEIAWFDISISNKCNQKCRICGPYNSTAWYKDAAELADLNWSHTKMPTHNADSSIPRVTEIIKLMQSSASPLTIEMKGGEPLYIPENRQLLKQMIALGLHERTEELRIITNGTQQDAELLSLLQQFPTLNIALSIDATGKLHEYVRGSNLSWDQCRRRWHDLTNLSNLKTLRVANTIYAYTIFDLGNLRTWIESEFGQGLDHADSLLHDPPYLRAKLVPQHMREIAASRLSSDDDMRDILQQTISDTEFGTEFPIEEEIEWLTLKFKQFTRRLDRLRGESLVELVPELAPMMA